MTLHSNTPVIVGAAAVQQRVDDPSAAMEAMTLMRTALEDAATDAGSVDLLDRATHVLITQGLWSSADPAAVVCPRTPDIHSVVAEIGVLQQTLFSRACALVSSGEAEIVLVCGAEAKFRSLRAQILGVTAPDTVTDGAPDERWVPATEIITGEEIERGLPVPARQYALIDTALRRAQGYSPNEQVHRLAELWAAFSVVAAGNPDAWSRDVIDTATLIEPSPPNPMLAWPYTKLHCSQWNVDQAAALIVCSASVAQRIGISRDRWVFAHVGVESNLMVPLTLRRDLHRSPAVAATGAAVLTHTGSPSNDIEQLDIYSCFPAAVRVQAAELGLDEQRRLTITGGMTFGGGPLNNYSLQSLAKMVQVLRDDPQDRGLVTNISGMLTKYGLSVWSCQPPSQPFAAIDVTEEARATTPTAPFDATYSGAARVLTYTVACDKGRAIQGIVVGETPAGARVLATTTDHDTMASMMDSEWCDRAVDVDGARLLS